MNARALKKKLASQHKRGLALDIDETIAWTVGSWVEQLQGQFGNPENLSVREMIAKYRYTQNVPYWQSGAALAWMDQQRHSDDMQEQLLPIEGAQSAVEEIDKLMPVVAYLTTRPTSVLVATQRGLLKHGFPRLTLSHGLFLFLAQKPSSGRLFFSKNFTRK